MSKEVTGSPHFLDSISEDAIGQSEHLLAEAEKRAEKKRNNIKNQIKSLEQELEEKKRREQEKADIRLRQNLSVALRREELRRREELNRNLMDQMEQKILSFRNSDSYLPVLKNWVLEAVLGLSVLEVVINGAARERELLSPAVLNDLEKELQSRWNLKVHLTLSEERVLNRPGIIAYEKDGRLIFNNQLHTRILRKQSQLRQRIYQRLFKEQS